MKIEDKLALLKYKFDKEPHIIVDTQPCRGCSNKPCIAGCPAGCFKSEEGSLKFKYEDCIECGTCRIVCPYDAVDWNYPRGSFGVRFAYG